MHPIKINVTPQERRFFNLMFTSFLWAKKITSASSSIKEQSWTMAFFSSNHHFKVTLILSKHFQKKIERSLLVVNPGMVVVLGKGKKTTIPRYPDHIHGLRSGFKKAKIKSEIRGFKDEAGLCSGLELWYF